MNRGAVIVDLDQDGAFLGLEQAEESGLTSFVSWSTLARILREANVGNLHEYEFIKQMRADEDGITVRIGNIK